MGTRLKVMTHSSDVKLIKTTRGYLRVEDLVEEDPSWSPKRNLIRAIFKDLTKSQEVVNNK